MTRFTPLSRRRGLRATRERFWWSGVPVIVALVIGSATTASAAFMITGRHIKDGSVTGVDLRDHSLTAKDLRVPVRGPRGSAGPAGPPGVAGPVGPAGPAAISGATVALAPLTIPGGPGESIALCPPGKLAVGGGGFSAFESASITQSAPADFAGHGWVTSFSNPTGANINVTTAVICATVR